MWEIVNVRRIMRSSLAITLTSAITVSSRSDAAATYGVRFTGSGEVLPAHGHLLIGGSGYTGAVVPDVTMSGGLTDKASVVVQRGAIVLDAVCEYCGLNPFDATYTCEGTPFLYTGCTSNNTDRSIERKPGGALGNATDTGDNSADFVISTPSNPQSSSSAPTP
jgi:hypothetical protein